MAYNKYRNIKTEVDGIKFDSKREAQRYEELKLLEKGGVISNLELQPKFELLPANKDKKNKAIKYVGDFAYIENKKRVVEDVKGMETDVFKMKKKMFESLYPSYELRIIK